MADNKEKRPSAEVWFDLKYWKFTLPIIYIAYLLYVLVPFSGVFTEIKEFNIEDCVKIEGESDFKHCEHFVLSNDSGIAYAACDPIKLDYNSVMGINRLEKGKPTTEGALWRVNYDQTPASIDKFSIVNGELKDFHPLGMTLDIHPETGEKTLLVVNLPTQGKARIEVFRVNEDQLELSHLRTIQHAQLTSPNSLHPIQDVRFRASDGTPSFFVSNDHYFSNRLLKSIENFLLHWSTVEFYQARTGQVKTVVRGLSFANGLAGNDHTLFVSETYRRQVKKYRVDLETVRLSHEGEARFEMAVDNLAYSEEKDLVVVAGHPKALNFLLFYWTQNKAYVNPTQVEVWNVKTGETKVLVQDDGSFFSGSTTAAIDFVTSHLIVSSILDQGILVCDL